MPDPIGYGNSTYRTRGLLARAAQLRQALQDRRMYRGERIGAATTGNVDVNSQLQRARKALGRQMRQMQGIPII